MSEVDEPAQPASADSGESPEQGSAASPTDYLGLASFICGIIAAICCAGFCIPYVNTILMLISMALSLIGTLVGVLAIFDRRRKEASAEFAWAGTISSGIVLILWILYWILVFSAVFLGMGVVVLLLLNEAL